MAGAKDEHAPALAALGIPAEVLPSLCRYLELVAHWNQRTNLTGAVSGVDRVRVLVADPWRAAPHVRAGSLIDVGSGNGSPGLVLALLRPDLQVVLLEPRVRRWAFLRDAARELGRQDVMVERSRSSEYAGSPAQTVTLRAVRPPVRDLSRLVAQGGEILLFGGGREGFEPFHHVASHPLENSALHVLRTPGATPVSRET
jgi:16S rRNA (guanine527-N7)-methyltransferase